MKKLLLASTAVVLSAGVAAADVTVGGNGRMGIAYNSADDNNFSFTSRIRITFAGSGETDTGMAFGGSIRADNASGGNAGTAGSVFISGAFGRLTMGDTDGAAQFAIGSHVAGVGLTGIGDHNESVFLGNNTDLGNARPTARYDYSFDAIRFAISHTNPGVDDSTAAIGIGYTFEGISAGVGYEQMRVSGGTNIKHAIVGLRGSFAGVDLAGNWGRLTEGVAPKRDQYAVSVGGTFDMTSVTAYYSRNFGGAKSYGLGASYDLGGGAALRGGVVRTDTGATKLSAPTASSRTLADFGVSFTF